jgi:hypothetical protein
MSKAQFPRRFNKLEMYETVLGHGSHGTIVYKGRVERVGMDGYWVFGVEGLGVVLAETALQTRLRQVR